MVIPNITKFSFNSLLLAFVVIFSSCMKEPEDPHGNQAKVDDEIIQNYLQANQIQANKASYGYYFYPIQENEGGKEVTNGDIISFYYTMNLIDGSLVASHTQAHGAPVKARHFSEAIFPVGLDLGLHHMKEGEIYKFILPSSLAYYQYTDNSILPQYANLILEVQLVKVSKADDQKAEEVEVIQEYIQNNQLEGVTVFPSGLGYQVLEAGNGSKPTAMQKVSVSYVGKLLDGTIFDQSTNGNSFSFTLGRQEVIKGWDQGIALMQKGEKARFFIPSYLAYDESVRIVPESLKNGLLESGAVGGFKASVAKSIPPFSILVFDVTLEDIL